MGTSVRVANHGWLAESDGVIIPLTPCCQASGKGSENATVCRKCYREVHSVYGACAVLGDKNFTRDMRVVLSATNHKDCDPLACTAKALHALGVPVPVLKSRNTTTTRKNPTQEVNMSTTATATRKTTTPTRKVSKTASAPVKSTSRTATKPQTKKERVSTKATAVKATPAPKRQMVVSKKTASAPATKPAPKSSAVVTNDIKVGWAVEVAGRPNKTFIVIAVNDNEVSVVPLNGGRVITASASDLDPFDIAF